LSKECAVDVTGLDLKELVALIAHSSIFIGNDSGPMHIAAAFARPIVAMFGGSNPTVWSPWTPGPQRVLAAPRAQPQYGEALSGSGSRKSVSPATVRDINRIAVQEVTAAVDEVILAGQPAR
jgi:ADP-heptose:LPS heptosyltransferase